MSLYRIWSSVICAPFTFIWHLAIVFSGFLGEGCLGRGIVYSCAWVWTFRRYILPPCSEEMRRRLYESTTVLFGSSLPRIWTGRTGILCPVLRPSKKTSLCIILPLFFLYSFICMFVVPFCPIIPASFHFDSAFIIFYYSFFPLCTYSIFTISILLVYIYCLTPVFFSSLFIP